MTKFEKQLFLSFKKNLFSQYRGLKHRIVFVFGCVGLLFDSHPLLHVKPYICSGLEVPTAWRIRPIPKRSSGNGHQRSAISYSNPCWSCTVFILAEFATVCFWAGLGIRTFALRSFDQNCSP